MPQQVWCFMEKTVEQQLDDYFKRLSQKIDFSLLCIVDRQTAS